MILHIFNRKEIMNYKEYVGMSLELHLFFDRIMKEHSFFIEMSFTEKIRKKRELQIIFKNCFLIF